MKKKELLKAETFIDCGADRVGWFPGPGFLQQEHREVSILEVFKVKTVGFFLVPLAVK